MDLGESIAFRTWQLTLTYIWKTYRLQEGQAVVPVVQRRRFQVRGLFEFGLHRAYVTF